MTSSPRYWWVDCDWVSYKVPSKKGKVILPDDYLEPGYEINTEQLKLGFVKSDKRLLGDFASWGQSAFLVNQRGYKVFELYFALHGRVFPVKCSGLQYYIFLCDIVLPGFDLEQSIYTRFGEDENIEEDIDQIKRIALKSGFSTEADIFRLDGSLSIRDHLIVSEKFRKQYEAAGLTGLFFTSTDPKDWDSHE